MRRTRRKMGRNQIRRGLKSSIGLFDAVYQCPFCGEIVRVPVDLGGGASQIETIDCQVCCRPAKVSLRIGPDGGVVANAVAE